MPVIDGKVHRSRFTSLKLRELSSVDNPAQPGARMAIMKRHDPEAPDRAGQAAELAKYICADDGAQSFSDVLAENKFSENVWPCVDALSQSIRSIVGDASLTGGEREAQISSSVQQFLSSVRDISPEVSKQLEPLLVRKKDDLMAKTVEELQGEVNSLTSKLAIATAEVAAEKVRADAAEKAKTDAMGLKDKADEDCKTAKAALVAATEETLKVGDVEVKKSEVGEAQFKLTKGLQDEALTARLEKRAGEDFPHVVGTSAEKALVLKSIANLPEDNPTRKALEAILTAAEKMTAAGFDKLGGSGGDSPTEKAAQSTFKGKIEEIRKRDSCSENQAMSKARSEYPEEFAAAYPNSAPAAQAAN